MIDVVVPEEQEGTKAVVRAWLKQVGERVEENDPLVELETDKVAMEVPAPAAGVLTGAGPAFLFRFRLPGLVSPVITFCIVALFLSVMGSDGLVDAHWDDQLS